MSDEAMWALGGLAGAWGLFMVWAAPKLSPTSVAHSFMALSLALLIAALAGPSMGDNQVAFVVALFLIPSLGTWLSARSKGR
jgi:hypothetical protein